MEDAELRRMRHLLTLLRRAGLERPKRRKTFMEVAGIERREVTISKILAFLLGSEAEHGLSDLWLRSLLLAASDIDPRFSPDSLQTSPTSAITEVVTASADRNLRVDVVVETPELVLGIENKIDAGLYNDLEAYAMQVREMAGGRMPLLLTLTLHDEASSTTEWGARCEDHGVPLCNVTYDALLANVKAGMGEAILVADREWLGYARDFMRTIENLGETQMQFDRELFEFMCENAPEIELLRSKMEEVASATKSQGVRLQARLAEDEEIAAMRLPRPRVWSPDKYYLWCSTYFHLELSGRKVWVHPEIANTLACVQVRCWVSGPTARSEASKAMNDAGLAIAEEHDNHLVYRNLPLEASDDELVAELKVLIRALLPLVRD